VKNKVEKETWKYAHALVALGPGSSQKNNLSLLFQEKTCFIAIGLQDQNCT
jgi:hypothetical protein